ncbi:hypothetical protein [Streptomyces sp. NK15101]|uniref:hypothetical protein n=1 Tax=Streptomyces sp. NK15101 TaxID=2873261 RepID=UPI001CED172D|nr:hypothetical protein [Streptomyces sp. NK15101]
MNRKKIAAATALALVTLVVFGWSVVMAAMGHAALIAVAAPVLGLTVTQVLHGVRPQTTPASGHRGAQVSDKEDDAP